MGILVYHRKMLKSTSLALPGEQSATVNGDGADDDKMEDIKDVYHLCKILFKMLARYPLGLRLDRMKKIMKEEFSCRLNEMTFQCTKLIELFRKEPLDSTFTIVTDKKAFSVRLGEPSEF